VAIALDEAQGVRMIVPRRSLLGEEAEALRRRLGEALAYDATDVVIDLRSVRYVSARALGVLAAHVVELRRRGGDLRLLGCLPGVRRLFDLCGLGSLFAFVGSEHGLGVCSAATPLHFAGSPEDGC